jgi:hypothetical protein
VANPPPMMTPQVSRAMTGLFIWRIEHLLERDSCFKHARKWPMLTVVAGLFKIARNRAATVGKNQSCPLGPGHAMKTNVGRDGSSRICCAT